MSSLREGEVSAVGVYPPAATAVFVCCANATPERVSARIRNVSLSTDERRGRAFKFPPPFSGAETWNEPILSEIAPPNATEFYRPNEFFQQIIIAQLNRTAHREAKN